MPSNFGQIVAQMRQTAAFLGSPCSRKLVAKRVCIDTSVEIPSASLVDVRAVVPLPSLNALAHFLKLWMFLPSFHPG